MMAKIVLVFLGGGLGAVIREFAILVIPRLEDGFPIDIFAVNVAASFILGLTFGDHRLNKVSDEFLLLIGTGVMGGLSTFSTFVFGAYSEMMRPGAMGLAVLYVLASAVVGYALTWCGIRCAAWRRRGGAA